MSTDPGQHYRFSYKGVQLDPFRIAQVYGITDFAQMTILKKALRMGTSHKDRKQDLLDIISAAERAIAMMEEDADQPADYTPRRSCLAVQFSDQMVCAKCNLTWDMNDPDPLECEA